MDLLEKYYDRQTFTLLALFIIVPGTGTWPRRIFLVFATAVLSFSFIIQLQKFVVEGLNMHLIIDLLPTTVAGCGCLVYIFYIVFMTHDEFAVLLSIMQTDIMQERTEEEEAIKIRHAKAARIFINMYSTLLLMATCGMPLSGLAPHFLDLLLPLNESRKKQLIYNGEIFFDQERYFYLIYFLESCSIVTVCVLVGASENMFVILIQHISGMFAVIGHRLSNLTHVKPYKHQDEISEREIISRSLKVCIEKHQISLEFAELIDDFYDIPASFILIATFCALTVSLVQVTDPELVSVQMIIFTVIQIVQLFIISCMGQNLINSSERLGEDAYIAEWYTCPPAIQKILQFVIIRSSKPCEFVSRRMYTLSVESFMSVIQTVTSCYMILRQRK